MPFVIRLKPGERLVVNGAEIELKSGWQVVVHGDVPVTKKPAPPEVGR